MVHHEATEDVLFMADRKTIQQARRRSQGQAREKIIRAPILLPEDQFTTVINKTKTNVTILSSIISTAAKTLTTS